MSFTYVTLLLLDGFKLTFLLFILTLAFSLPLGLIVAFGSMSKFKPLKVAVRVFVWIIRGTPLMLQLFVVFYVPNMLFGTRVFNGDDGRFLAALIAFVINYAAYFAEIYRGGILSVEVGQWEAAKALGLGRATTFLRVILPQMVKRVIPAIGNEVITLVKDTSLAFTIAVTEMFTLAKQLSSANTTMMPLIAAGVFYYIFNYAVAWLMERIERRFAYYR